MKTPGSASRDKTTTLSEASKPPSTNLRLTRRRLLGLGVGGAALATISLTGACRRGSGGEPTQGIAPASRTPASPTGGARETPASTPSAVGSETTPSPSPTAPPDEEQIFYQGGYNQDPTSHDFSIDPNCGGEPELWAGLLTLDPDLHLLPDWAASWETNQDATRWTFHLREDNHGWSNGDPVTAHDFIWSWQRHLSSGDITTAASPLLAIANADELRRGQLDPAALGVSAPDDWTLQVEMSKPTVTFPAAAASLAAVAVYRPAVERFGATWTEADHCVCNGPFKLDVWEHGSRYEISRNEGYWNAEQVALTRCVTPIMSGAHGIGPYVANQVDMIPVPGTDVAIARGDAILSEQLEQGVDTAIWMLVPQAMLAPFTDVRVRRALAHAIDRDRVVQVTLGRTAAARGLLPLDFPSHVDDNEFAALQRFDVDAALAALQGTPFAGGNGWPELSLSMRRADPDAQLIAQDIAAQLSENLGMRLTLDVMEPDKFDAALAEHSLPLVWIRFWFNQADPDDGYRRIFWSGNPDGRTFAWSNADYDALIVAARGETSDAKRSDLYRQCERILQTDVAYIPVVYPVGHYLVKPWISDVPKTSHGNIRTNGSIFSRMKASIRIQGRPQQPDLSPGPIEPQPSTIPG